MITVEMLGGLGNQLFRYATGRSLAQKHKTGLILDVSHYEKYKLRMFELGCFNIKAEVRNSTDIFTRIARGALKFFPGQKTYREKHYHFDPGFFDLPDGIYLSGYFQSEKYFSPIAVKLKQELTLKTITYTAKKLLKEIDSTDSVSVHVRRGDYVDNPATRKLHGVCSSEYFRKAFDLIGKKVNEPRYYFFSDDISWVKRNMKLKAKSFFVAGNTAVEDLILMERCKHNIIVNSTYGWWAAWLNKNPQKIVIAPDKWYLQGPKDTRDLLPESWLKI
ncbi:hypothetical protein A3J20_03560 [Candidatus Gottesmanbacteria bacterium RIFCSPLOWO2_02_FULL_42_29]|uniref:Glycosyl transferase family 11 n=2 Tax=Candidatus Gottesmaniibacteriota TaxID=1752720 RepID=A0A1F6BHH1_9BACT|nr:MAG: Glycosyl transferase family protein [Candidatus Gottesmanbacteria bacterium GW2011_GWA2_42_18]OGG09292.1 MAG: hypothetical protein A2781_03060 [Candidatus Gottesmanbacteria bacterium RIFCSPHIGHO2_01_FULL_42_27]OGG22652.1 MAG: hypothetical protein A3E72_02080 [Candidatus Gottesmanbacteria bacterium RIFCSPHIGHO2_12_FULL_43_26]OGG33353.1 MAG: hypothetical protein A3G68_02205 [Candidatus Gottesmanbacteria bacterium RIFCSPLOWO2_12_FULL_42_10]OGG36328.1 MAG: hypothetical protein A2968_06180 [